MGSPSSLCTRRRLPPRALLVYPLCIPLNGWNKTADSGWRNGIAGIDDTRRTTPKPRGRRPGIRTDRLGALQPLHQRDKSKRAHLPTGERSLDGGTDGLFLLSTLSVVGRFRLTSPKTPCPPSPQGRTTPKAWDSPARLRQLRSYSGRPEEGFPGTPHCSRMEERQKAPSRDLEFRLPPLLPRANPSTVPTLLPGAYSQREESAEEHFYHSQLLQQRACEALWRDPIRRNVGLQGRGVGRGGDGEDLHPTPRDSRRSFRQRLRRSPNRSLNPPDPGLPLRDPRRSRFGKVDAP